MVIFDDNTYATVPNQSAALTISLARRLVAEMPPALVKHKGVAMAADRTRTRAESLRTERLRQLELPAPVDARPYDQEEDNAWGALYERLSACSRLRSAQSAEKGARAAELVARLFPNRLSFLLLPYKAQWEESERMLALVDAEGLGDERDELCGEE